MNGFKMRIYAPLFSILLASSAAYAESFFTSFEFSNSGTFSIGDTPLSATFSGGSAQTVGVAAYYHSGRFSWHVPSAGMANVTFETPVESVNFWFRDTNGAASSSYQFFDTNGTIIRSGNGSQSFVNVGLERSESQTRIARLKFSSVGGGDTVVDDFGYTVTEPVPPTDSPVNLSGRIQTENGTDICALVLASGQFMFSCNPAGLFSLNNLPREPNGTVRRQIYADGFFPKVQDLEGSVAETVILERAHNCPSYNLPSTPDLFPKSAGNVHKISGRVLLQNTDTPVCALVLANGTHMFSCDGMGNYSLEFPLDQNGQYKLQVYANGFAPAVQKFNEFDNPLDVRMAKSTECDTDK
jgi:hypothetical protein